jgi:hypothetical protein
MDTPTKIGDLAKRLSPEDQAKVLALVESLLAQSAPKNPPRSLAGLWAGCPPITEEDIAENRKEMFRNFPREDV